MGSSGANSVPYSGASDNVDLGDHDIYGANVNRAEGLDTDPTITQGAGCSINISSAKVHIRTDTVFGADGKLLSLTVPAATNLPLPDDTVSHIYVDYNAGSPIYAASTDRLIFNMSDHIPAGRVAMRAGLITESATFGYLGRSVGARMLQRTVRLEPTVGIARESGLMLTESGTRLVSISAGKAWMILNQVDLPQITQGDAGVVTRHWYHSGGNWTFTDVAQYPNTHYDTGTDLVELTAGRFAVLWIYRCISSNEMSIISGSGDYTINEAQESDEPTRPPDVSEFSIIVGRIIVQKSANVATIIQSTFTTSFAGVDIGHNLLTGKQGGTDDPSGQYYHLTSAEYIDVGTIPDMVPYTGATTDVDVGVHSVYADNTSYSEGMFDDPTITDAAGTAISVASADVLIRSAALWAGDGRLYRKTVPANTALAVTDNTLNYIYVDYNAGSPIYAAATTNTALNHSNVIPVARVYMESGNIKYTLAYGYLAKGQGVRNIDRIYRIRGVGGSEHETGLTVTETGTRVVTISAGYAWTGLRRVALDAIAQGGAGVTSYLWSHTGGNWTETAITEYNNTQYDNGTNLATLTANRYAVNWIYRNLTSNVIDITLGGGDYTLSQAESSMSPTPPPVIAGFYVLVGRIIVQKSAATAYVIENVASTVFRQAAVATHNDLNAIQGGITGEYYHLTAAQLAWIVAQMGV